jgi:hypothetical protein
MNENGLTQQQIIQQDFIANSIFLLIQVINPDNKEIERGIDMIGEIRDVLKEGLVDNELLRGLKPDDISILNRGEN